MPPIPYSRLHKDLLHIGLHSTDTLMMHLSLKSIGWIIGGGNTLLKALLDILLPEGTLCMMIGWEDYPYALPSWPAAKQQAYIKECPPFDPATSRANIWEFGILTEYLRTYPAQVFRSQHPTASFAAIGKQAAFITANHPLNYGFGIGSPLDKIHNLKGKILHIGCPFNTVTMLHYAEDRCAVQNKKIVQYQMPILVDGKKKWVQLEEYDTSEGIYDWQGEDYFELIMKDYVASRKIGPDKVGEADAYLIDSQELVAFGKTWMETKFKVSRQDY